MMSAAHKTVLPTLYDEQPLRGDHAIYNRLLDLLKSRNLGWSLDIVETTGIKFLKLLADCLWTLDPHHDQLIPEDFSVFAGFNNLKRKKNIKSHNFLKQYPISTFPTF